MQPYNLPVLWFRMLHFWRNWFKMTFLLQRPQCWLLLMQVCLDCIAFVFNLFYPFWTIHWSVIDTSNYRCTDVQLWDEEGLLSLHSRQVHRHWSQSSKLISVWQLIVFIDMLCTKKSHLCMNSFAWSIINSPLLTD